jgi:hypothetical protein
MKMPLKSLIRRVPASTGTCLGSNPGPKLFESPVGSGYKTLVKPDLDPKKKTVDSDPQQWTTVRPHQQS